MKADKIRKELYEYELKEKIEEIISDNICSICRVNKKHEYGNTYRITGFKSSAEGIVRLLKDHGLV